MTRAIHLVEQLRVRSTPVVLRLQQGEFPRLCERVANYIDRHAGDQSGSVRRTTLAKNIGLSKWHLDKVLDTLQDWGRIRRVAEIPEAWAPVGRRAVGVTTGRRAA
jgi:hypothetical protein